MNLLTLYRVLGPVDARNVWRDRLLAWILGVPLLLALLLRYGVPPLTAWLAQRWGFDLVPYEPLLMSFYIALAPAMAGMVVGFLLLDERDEQVLTALRVTPLPPAGYLAYRISVPLLLGFLVTLVGYPLAGHVPLSPGVLLPVLLLAACAGPFTALFLVAFAENKVAGLALVKIINSVNMLPVVAYCVVPAYWPMKVLWVAAEGGAIGVYAVAGIAVNILALVLLARHFVRRMAG